MTRLEEFNERFKIINEELENENFEVENDLLDLEQDNENELLHNNGKERRGLISLQMKIKSVKKEFDFYDEEAELDYMFPNRHDEDFDEDSMSYESVFGGD